MEMKLNEVLEKALTIDFIEAVISNSSNKELCSKMKLRPVMLKGQLLFQLSKYVGQKVYHTNYTKEEIITQSNQWISGDPSFRQMEFTSKQAMIVVLVSKKGKITVKEKKRTSEKKQTSLSHNREKKYILEEGISVPFLVDLGVMTKEGMVVKSKYDKYRQINRFLEFIEDILPSLDKNRKLTILDFGCGKSYLTFAMYYYLKELKNYNIQIIGLDLKKDVISNCNELASRYGYEELHFLEGDIASYEGVTKVDMVVTLHACDTATDYALYKAIRWGASVILSVPCCQHEFNKQMQIKKLEPIFKYGLIKERSAALFTDAIRANILEEWGYKSQILEFIDMEHTPKNILIRAVKNHKIEYKKKGAVSYSDCLSFFDVELTLQNLLKDYKKELENS